VEQSSEIETLSIASLSILDVKVVVVFLDWAPDQAPGQAIDTDGYAALQRTVSKAGLDGNVVAVWPDEFGRTRFFAPPEQHAFFRVVGYDQLRAQINGQINGKWSRGFSQLV
jgi:hypothetical protein